MTWVTGTEITLSRLAPDGTLAEQIGVTGTDDAWLWVRRPLDPARGDAVGTWRAPLAAELAADLRGLVAALLGTSANANGDAAAGAVPGPTHATLEVATSGAARQVDAGAGADERRLHALAAEIAELAFGRPTAVARFSTASLPPEGGQPAAIALLVAGAGEEPVALTLDGGRLGLRAAPGSAVQTLPAPVIGLVDASGELLDGVFATAVIPPGVVGSLVLAADPPAGGAAVIVSGRIRLVGPWSGRELPVPADAFAAEARLAGSGSS